MESREQMLTPLLSVHIHWEHKSWSLLRWDAEPLKAEGASHVTKQLAANGECFIRHKKFAFAVHNEPPIDAT
jgi:hypothetical protein